MSGITYHEKETANELWLDIALNGKRTGYIYKPYGDAFYHVHVDGVVSFDAYLTLEQAKENIATRLGQEEEWATEIS